MKLAAIVIFMNKFWRLLLRLAQKRCRHSYSEVKADILEGDTPNLNVLWCECCGAFALKRNNNRSEFRRPRPDYFTHSILSAKHSNYADIDDVKI